jgi:hypothetical protein
VSRQVFLHIGLPKSGTTYLQDVLGTHREQLSAESRLLYPGRTWDDQVLAALDVLHTDLHGAHDPETVGAWDRLAAEVRQWTGDAVISMEWLASAAPEQARRMVESFQGAAVNVVLTVRDLGRTIPGAWQEYMCNWETWSWEEFLDGVTAEDSYSTSPGELFWTQQDLPRILSLWTSLVPASQVHVVVVPRGGAAAVELWERFADALGIDASRYGAPTGGSNASLGVESATFMRRLNVATRQAGVHWPEYNDAFKHVVAKDTLSRRRAGESTLGIPPRYEDRTMRLAAHVQKAIVAAGVRVVGEIADLEPLFPPTTKRPDDVPDADLVDVALEALIALSRSRSEVVTERDALREAMEAAQARLRADDAALRSTIRGLDALSLWSVLKRRITRRGERSRVLAAVRRVPRR